MAFKMTKGDYDLLCSIAEFRLLTPRQLAAITQRNSVSVRRRISIFEHESLIQTMTHVSRRNPGRPERLISLKEKGLELLQNRGILKKDISKDKVYAHGLHHLDHLILVNWFRVHLSLIESQIPRLSIRFLSDTSPLLESDKNGNPFVYDRIPSDHDLGKFIGIIPDGVFSITDSEQKKTLLFFLEADMGTESIAGARPASNDVRQKILNYQGYFQCARYKRYEEEWECKLNGFRLLVLVNTRARLVALCRLVREMPPSDFIWLTDQEQMFNHGVGAKIWFRGGKDEISPQSILGAQMAFRSNLD